MRAYALVYSPSISVCDLASVQLPSYCHPAKGKLSQWRTAMMHDMMLPSLSHQATTSPHHSDAHPSSRLNTEFLNALEVHFFTLYETSPLFRRYPATDPPLTPPRHPSQPTRLPSILTPPQTIPCAEKLIPTTANASTHVFSTSPP
jgi:hypothetical protein